MKKINFRIQRNNNLNDVFVEDVPGPGNGRHRYAVMPKGCSPEDKRPPLLYIHFQERARNTEGSTPGVLDSDLLEIVRHRLQSFQKGEYATRENACAITHIEEALMWIAKRVDDRAERGVLGTMNK